MTTTKKHALTPEHRAQLGPWIANAMGTAPMDDADRAARVEAVEIEVTPEMLDAGLDVLCLWHQGEDSAEQVMEILAEVFRVMASLHPRFLPPGDEAGAA